jgi:hypothetical protein
MGDGLGYCWRATELSSSVRNSARTVLLKSAANLGHRTYNTNIYSENTALRWRTIAYFDDGGHRLNPFAFLFGGDFAILNNTPDNNMMAQGRQAIPLMITTFGWAWEMTGHPWYKTQGDEMINAAFASTGENTIGSGADNVRTLCDATSNFKDYGQCYRSAARYFGHRLTTPSSLGTAPVVTMPGNVTLTGGVNQAELTASVACTNTPCVYKWTLKEYPQVRARNTARPTFFPDNALSTKLSGLESGPYKATFYTIDALGLEGHGEVTITAGDGQFPPTVWIGEGTSGAITSIYIFSTTSSSVTGAVRSCSIAGRTLSHSFSAKAPKDKSAPTISPSATTGGCGPNITFTVSGLSAGLWIVKDTVTDSAGLSRTAVLYIRHTAENQPSSAHNTIPDVAAQPDHVLPEGSTSTKLYVVPLDPEGIVGYPNSASGYTGGYDGAPPWLVTALTHSWSQQSGPTTATITNGSTLQPEITGLSAGVYVFRYSGTDQQGDVATTDITVTVQGDEPVEPTALKLMAICTSIIVAFYSVPLLLMLLQQRLDQRRRLRTIKLPRFITYQSVIGPDHRKQLRAHLDATFEPHLTTRRANASKQ